MRAPTFLALLFIAGCAPEPPATELHATVLSSVGEILHPTALYVHFDEPKSELTIYEKLDGPQLAQGPAAAGTKLAITLGARACELDSSGPRVDTDLVEKHPMTETANDPGFRTRKTKVVSVTLRCADGLPPPGIEAPPSIPGWTVTFALLGVIALGLVLGRVRLSDNSYADAGVALFAVIALVVAVVLLWSRLEGGLVLSLPLLGLVCGTSAAAAPTFARDKGPRAKIVASGLVAGSIAGPALVAATTPLWAGAAPLVAALVVVVCFVVFAAIGVSGD